MISTRFELSNKPTKRGGYAIMLVVTIGGKRKRVSTRVEVDSKSHFDYKASWGEWITKGVSKKVDNQRLKDIIAEAESKYSKLDADDCATAEGVKQALKSRSDSFIKYGDAFVQGYYDLGQLSYWKVIRKAFNKFKAFADSKHYSDVTFADLTPRLIQDFVVYLRNQRNARHPEMVLSPSTINQVVKLLKFIVNDGKEHGKIPEGRDPFKMYKPLKVAKTKKAKLTPSEINALASLELKEGGLLWHSRNAFLFSYYAAGIRVSDLLRLRWCNIQDGKLIYTMQKTEKDPDPVLVPQALQILSLYHTEETKPSDFIFPFFGSHEAQFSRWLDDVSKMPLQVKREYLKSVTSKTALYNKNLSKLAGLAGIDKKLSSHIARHSFATRAVQAGLAGAEVQSLLGHSSLKTTETYLGTLDTSQTDAALNRVFDTSNQPTDKREQLLKLLEGMSNEDVESVLATLKPRQ